MQEISIKTKMAISVIAAIAISMIIIFHASHTKAQSAPTLSGSCGFVSNSQKWGFTPIAGNKYDWGVAYGVYNFDAQTVVFANSDVDVKAVGTEPDYSERVITASITISAHPRIPNTYKVSFQGSEDYMTVISTNGGNTFLLAGRNGDATGVCQKL